MKKPFIIAEAGVHHNCNLHRAFLLVEAAARAGADAIKFQTYRAERIVTYWAPRYWDCGEKPGTQFDTFLLRGQFGTDDYLAIAEHCKRNDIMFLSTPFDVDVVDWLERCDVPLYKIASADLTNYPLLKRVAHTGKPVIMATGASNYEEIAAAVSWLKQNSCKDISLLHCCLCYPAPYVGVNLRKVITLKQAFPDCRIGYSDHVIPDEALSVCLGAVALGAEIIEKHFTLDRSLPEDDHYHAVDELLLARLVEGANNLSKALGGSDLQPSECELEARYNARRSIVAAYDLPKGTVLNWSNIDFKRPGHGIAPTNAEDIIGKVLTFDCKRDDLIEWRNLK